MEQFIGTVKRALDSDSIADEKDLTRALLDVRQKYNYDRLHDHLQGRTSAEVWAGVDVFATRPG